MDLASPLIMGAYDEEKISCMRYVTYGGCLLL